EVREIFFNEPLRSATVFLSDGTNDTENLGAPGVVLISDEIIADLDNTKGKEPITIEDDLDSDLSSQVDETNENDILNLEKNQWAEDSHINDYFKTSKRK
ncbi:1343_t:CDS:2, partial [Gigaspora margarita]